MLSFHSEQIDFTLSTQKKIIDWISQAVSNEQKELGEICYIFCSDDYLLKLNKEHLNHDYFTDVITFNYCEGNKISADVFISIDRVRDNAIKYEVSFDEELARVLIHGVLHLVGYNDKNTEEQEQMTAREDFYLSLLSN